MKILPLFIHSSILSVQNAKFHAYIHNRKVIKNPIIPSPKLNKLDRNENDWIKKYL